MPSGEPEELDSGLARERTRLAWARTAIAFAAVGGAMASRELVPGVIVLAISPVIWGLGRVTSRQARPERHSRRLLLVTAIVTAVAALAAIVAFAGSGPANLHDLLPLHG